MTDEPVCVYPDGLEYQELYLGGGEYLTTDNASSAWAGVIYPVPINPVPAMVSFKAICQQLEQYFDLLLSVRYIASKPYLSFVHHSKRVLRVPSGGANLLTDYKGRNWSVADFQAARERMCFREVWNTPQSDKVDFSGDKPCNQITYPTLQGHEESQKEHDASQLITDLAAALVESAPGVWVVAAYHPGQGIVSLAVKDTQGVHSGKTETNGCLSLSRVLRDYHVSGRRVTGQGKVGEAHYTFPHPLPLREVAKVECPAACKDFDTESYVVTDLGNGELQEVAGFFDGRYSEVKILL
jgi:hypothetical protein